MDDFRTELQHVLNKHSMENESNTPDFILAEFLGKCLAAWDETVIRRAQWYERMDEPGVGSIPYPNPHRED